MSFAGYASRNHPFYTGGVRDSVDDRSTPDSVFGPLHDRYGFTIDVAAADHNAKLPRYFTAEQNGLAQSWATEVVWCNPPFSRLRPWVGKAWREHRTAAGIVMLVPATRTEQDWWQDLVEPYRDRPGSPLRTEFLPGRPRFLYRGQLPSAKGDRPMFGCVLLIWEPTPVPAEQMLLSFDGDPA